MANSFERLIFKYIRMYKVIDRSKLFQTYRFFKEDEIAASETQIIDQKIFGIYIKIRLIYDNRVDFYAINNAIKYSEWLKSFELSQSLLKFRVYFEFHVIQKQLIKCLITYINTFHPDILSLVFLGSETIRYGLCKLAFAGIYCKIY